MTPADFFARLAPAARDSARRTGVPAGFVCAQGALESAWGTSGLCVQANNLFGVKADSSWHGPVVDMLTHEYVHARNIEVMAPWRRFATWEDCVDDHAQFFHLNARYAPAFKVASSEAFARAIALAGYATDPAYADKLVSVIRAHALQQYDLPAVALAPPVNHGGTAPPWF